MTSINRFSGLKQIAAKKIAKPTLQTATIAGTEATPATTAQPVGKIPAEETEPVIQTADVESKEETTLVEPTTTSAVPAQTDNVPTDTNPYDDPMYLYNQWLQETYGKNSSSIYNYGGTSGNSTYVTIPPSVMVTIPVNDSSSSFGYMDFGHGWIFSEGSLSIGGTGLYFSYGEGIPDGSIGLYGTNDGGGSPWHSTFKVGWNF